MTTIVSVLIQRCIDHETAHGKSPRELVLSDDEWEALDRWADRRPHYPASGPRNEQPMFYGAVLRRAGIRETSVSP